MRPIQPVRFGSIFVVDARHLGKDQAVALKTEIGASYPAPMGINAATPKSLAYPLMDPDTQALGDKVERVYYATIEDDKDDHFTGIARKHDARVLAVEKHDPNMAWNQHLDRAGDHPIAQAFSQALRNGTGIKRMMALGNALTAIGNFLNTSPQDALEEPG